MRVEDPALLTGQGRFVDDLEPPGLLHACLVRSPVAHGIIVGIDTSAARDAPGAVAVLTASDLRDVGPLPAPPGLEHLAMPILHAVGERVRWAGEPVALVVAATPEQAQDAAELVDIDYQPLAAVTTPDSAGEICVTTRLTGGDAASAFAAARHRVRQRMVSQRLAPVPLEPRGVLARRAEDGRLDVTIGTQRPHSVRTWLARMFGLPENEIRVSTGDVGGAFGAKGPLYPDQAAAIAAALLLDRPVKWIEDRLESFLATTHARDQVADLELALTENGVITAIRGTVRAGLGAYLTPNAVNILTGRLGPLLGQCYAIGAVDVELTGVRTNTTPTGPYRGAGRPEAAYFTERLVDLAAHQTGLDPAEIRRRNLIPKDRFPYTTCTGLTYDSGDYPAALDLALAGYDDLRADQQEARASGTLRGIGLCCFVEPGGIMPPGPPDRATVTRHEDGTITVAVGTSGHGQGHKTTFARLAADILGVPPERVTVVHSDTDTAPFGYGTFGSRSTVTGGTAVRNACRMLLAEGGGTASAEAEVHGDTYAAGAYLCVVDIDEDTGRIAILSLIAVDDCGTVLSPLLVEGQVQGGVAQGIGQVLTERVSYDQDGQLLTASLLDYALPTADLVPPVQAHRCETPSPANPLGVKGVGESGTIGATAALANAVMDALSPLGIRHLDMPLTPEKVWTAIRRARQVY